MRVKCDDCPCLCTVDGGWNERCNLMAVVEWDEASKTYVGENCPLVEVRYWKDGELERFTPVIVQNPANPREG